MSKCRIHDAATLIKQKEEEIEQLKREKEEIIEQEKIVNKEALELSKQLQKLKEIRDKTNKAIIETQEKLYKLCTHDKIRTEGKYIEGGYLNVSESWTYYYCELCGQLVDQKVTYGTYA